MKSATALVVLALGLASPVNAAEITVLSTGGARAVMTSLVPEYERISGDKVTIGFATPSEMRDKLVKGEAAAEPGVPESFNVLIRELQSLCLDVELMKKPRELLDTALAAD